MKAEPNITRIKSALEMYRWNKSDVFKKDENGESYGAFGMLLRDVGVPTEEFSKHRVPQLVIQNLDKLEAVYGLRDAVDLELITVANDCSESQQEMVSKTVEYLSGNYSSVSPGLRYWLLSLVEQRSQYPMKTIKTATNKYITEEKYRDIRWQKERIEILERDGKRCQFVDEKGNQCAVTLKDQQLDIHHRNYTEVDPWNEPSENLIALCRKHHDKYESNANLGQAARDVCNALMKSNWMVGQRKLLARCISGKIVSPEELCRFIRERMK
jgi:hypothetical protein